MTARASIVVLAGAVAMLAGAICGSVLLPPYLCGWLPPYSSPLTRARYYWSSKAQFLQCNAVLHEIAAAKDEYELGHDIARRDLPLTPAEIGIPLDDIERQTFRCPSGGRYTINPPGRHPVCSIHGDSLAWVEGQGYPTRENRSPVLQFKESPVETLGEEDRIDVPPPDEGSGID
ncbi:MAG: hypothetical protein WCL44_04770 [bacterium]